MEYTPKATSIINRIITLLTTASTDGTFTYPYMNFLKHDDHVGKTRYPLAVVRCTVEDFSPDKNNIAVTAVFSIDMFYVETRQEYKADALRQIAHETRRVIVKDPPAELFHIGDVRYGEYAERDTGNPAGRAVLRITMKYKERR